MALLSLGEIGRRFDLSSYPTVATSIQAALDSDSEDVKAAASVALGGITSGHLAKYLPSLLQQVRATAGNPKQQYLLLQALNEVVVNITSSSSGGSEQQAVALSPGRWGGGECGRGMEAWGGVKTGGVGGWGGGAKSSMCICSC